MYVYVDDYGVVPKRLYSLENQGDKLHMDGPKPVIASHSLCRLACLDILLARPVSFSVICLDDI